MSISKKAHIADNVIIGNNVTIEDDVYIDYAVIIRDNVHIKRNTYIGARCILGEYLADFYIDKANKYHPLIIGENSVIRSETIIYGDTEIGSHFQTGHRVTVREKAKIGNHVRIGTLSDIQGDCTIEDYVNLHSNVHVGMKSIIKKYARIFPYVVLTNDPNPPSDQLLGVTINEYAVVATGSIILPGIDVGKDSLIAAGAIVTKDVSSMKVYAGNPAKEICEITKIKNRISGETVYPWRYTFDRGMPWCNIGYDKWSIEEK